MNDEANRLKEDLQIIQNAMGMNLWTRRDVRRGFVGLLGGGLAGLFLAIWSARQGAPEVGLIVLLAILSGIVIAKGIGFERQPKQAPGSVREIAFYNRFYSVGAGLTACFYIWGTARHLDPMIVLALTIILIGAWYLFYAVSAASRGTSLGGAIPLMFCGFLLPEAASFSEALSWLGIAMCVGCCMEAALLWVALRPPTPPPSDMSVAASPIPPSPNPALPLSNAAH